VSFAAPHPAESGSLGPVQVRRERNDPAQYDDLAAQWWDPRGPFVMLHWLAAARAALVPPATGDAVLVDLGCGAGLVAPHLGGKGYRHVGVDITTSALTQAREHGVAPVRGSVDRIPLRDGCADVVVAGEILEHVTDLPRAVAEACRLLRPGGLLVIDTIAATALARLVAIRISERLPAVPKGIHDPDLLVDRRVLVRECARHGVALTLRGIAPSVADLARWLVHRADTVRMTTVPTTAVLFQAVGRKATGAGSADRPAVGHSAAGRGALP
jgi:2-polyprenyl-6-hydroxyphenyl methylase / 3-demethylubiquinone-9 3-methyltransferase